MHTGRLRHRVTIKRPSEVQNATGEIVPTWVNVATVWASVEAVSGGELLKADIAVAEGTVRVRMRYVDDVTPECRIIVLTDGDRILEIVHINNVHGRNAEYEIMCREDV